MHILLDESIPQDLRREFVDHDVKTVGYMGWLGVKNGQLLELAAEQFDVFITLDQNLEYQQNLRALPLAVIVVTAKNNRIETVKPLVPDILYYLKDIAPKTLERVPKTLLVDSVTN